jgi:signal transduction histidine kinase
MNVQFNGVIVLVTALVIVPTVCLVWFMAAALEHSELALREELVLWYQDRVLEVLPIEDPGPITRETGALGQVLYNDQGICVFPFLYADSLAMSRTAMFDTASALEHQDYLWKQALDLYRLEATVSSIPTAVYECTLGQIRCLRALGQLDEALVLCQTLAFPEGQAVELFSANQIAQASLMLVDLAVDANAPAVLEPCLASVMASEDVVTETQVFVLQRMVHLIQQAGMTQGLEEILASALKEVQWGSLSVAAADCFPDRASVQGWGGRAFQSVSLNGRDVYARSTVADGAQALMLVSTESIRALFDRHLSTLNDKKVFFKIRDLQGTCLNTFTVEAAEFFTKPLTGSFEGWTLSLGFREGIFSELATQQRRMYLWTGLLVVGMTGVLGVVVGRGVHRERKLGRLKNDFMATVTHELKTPLASTRLLVDTLLEDQCADPTRVQEYLTLIAKENKRLCGLIDNFLTFSRMERNKQVFDRQLVSVNECVKAACEAMQTRVQDQACDFTWHVEDNLPKISVDKPAFVTVLVNLLDNALKYTQDHKVVQLEVTRAQDSVCFKVTDNGIGMTPRQAKKAFDRFYQADTSLTRDKHGCGLGLAIVKYIVKAHDGQVTVESVVGEGTVFTVKIAAS